MDPLPALTLGAVTVSLLAVADGVDLGIGILFPLARRERDRTALMQGVTPVRHGNEAWLTLGAVGLCAALPLGYHRVPAAFLPPIAAMLSALILRGIVLESQVDATRFQSVRVAAVAGGSLVAGPVPGPDPRRMRPAWAGADGAVWRRTSRLPLAAGSRVRRSDRERLRAARGPVLVPSATDDGRPRRPCAREAPQGSIRPARGASGVVNGASDYVRNLAPGE